MAGITPADIPLPDFLDPLLSYLSSALPPPLYSFVISLLAHSLALLSALFSLVLPLITTNPFEWDAQTILPPLITVLAAYLALISVYRTTSWMIRTTFWFIKWGTIFGALMAASGWYLAGAGSGVAGRGIASSLGGFVLDMINGDGQNAAGGSRSTSQSRSSRTRTRTSGRQKPKPWESFERHQEWQEGRAGAGNDGEIQKIMGNIVGAAGRVMRDSGWWDAAKSVVDGLGRESNEQEAENDKAKADRSSRVR